MHRPFLFWEISAMFSVRFSQHREQPIWTDLRGCFPHTENKKGNVETFPVCLTSMRPLYLGNLLTQFKPPFK